jgi:rSAM-associated Gly-rich repeat protein
MLLRQRYRRILLSVLPIGAVGASLLLGLAAPAKAEAELVSAQAVAGSQGRVADRLAAIRDAVSDIAGPAGRRDQKVAWWAWRNGGWGNGGWRNGGWRNGGWGNGGWHNGWHNWWHNW